MTFGRLHRCGGEALETAPLLKALEKADGKADWHAAARAIMTTDTFQIGQR